jgi:ABC-type sugar transport system substrate-binding protein
MKKVVVLASLLLIATFAAAQTSLPTGTAVKMKLDTTLATFSSKAGDPFSARVTESVVMDGKTVIPVGTTVEGRVTKSTEPRRISGQADDRDLS